MSQSVHKNVLGIYYAPGTVLSDGVTKKGKNQALIPRDTNSAGEIYNYLGIEKTHLEQVEGS